MQAAQRSTGIARQSRAISKHSSSRDEEKELLRFSTAGSVDDGKSTLIGRLLYDSKGVYEDQLASVRQVAVNRSPARSIWRCSPTGCAPSANRASPSTSPTAISPRPSASSSSPIRPATSSTRATWPPAPPPPIWPSFWWTRATACCRNRAVTPSSPPCWASSTSWSRSTRWTWWRTAKRVFNKIREEFADYAARLQAPRSSLHSHQRAQRRQRGREEPAGCRGSTARSLLHYLETVHIASDRNLTEFRFPGAVRDPARPELPRLCRPGGVGHGQAGRSGDGVAVRAHQPREIDRDLRRRTGRRVPADVGDALSGRRNRYQPRRHAGAAFPSAAHLAPVDARLVWMHEQKLEIGANTCSNTPPRPVQARVDALRYRVNINTLEKEAATELRLNDIGAVVIETHKPIFCDPYRRNRATGSFILIDPLTNATVAAGMITGREPGPRKSASDAGAPSFASWRVSPADQQSRAGHRAVTLWLDTAAEVAYQLERLLFDAECRVHAVPASATIAETCRTLNDAGVIALVYGSTDPEERESTRSHLGADNFLHIEKLETVERIHHLLKEEGIISF